MKKIYIASFFDDRARIRKQAAKLWEKGYDVVSSWLNEVNKPEHMSREEFWFKLAVKDVAEVKSADLVIVDTISVTPRGGRECEMGIAIGDHQGKSIYLVGPVRNVFHTLADKHYKSWDQLVKELPSIKKVDSNPKTKKKKK